MIKTLIQQISNWKELSSSELLSRLQEKTIQYLDKKQYRLDDIAKLIGEANMNTFLDVVRAAGYDWMITQAASGFYPYEDPINSRLRALGHPLSIQIADHTNRMISILEQNGLDSTEAEIEEAKQSLLLEDRKQQLMTTNAERWNQFCNAVDTWDGVSAQPEL